MAGDRGAQEPREGVVEGRAPGPLLGLGTVKVARLPGDLPPAIRTQYLACGGLAP
jgi:hypothetical protein